MYICFECVKSTRHRISSNTSEILGNPSFPEKPRWFRTWKRSSVYSFLLKYPCSGLTFISKHLRGYYSIIFGQYCPSKCRIYNKAILFSDNIIIYWQSATSIKVTIFTIRQLYIFWKYYAILTYWTLCLTYCDKTAKND